MAHNAIPALHSSKWVVTRGILKGVAMTYLSPVQRRAQELREPRSTIYGREISDQYLAVTYAQSSEQNDKEKCLELVAKVM